MILHSTYSMSKFTKLKFIINTKSLYLPIHSNTFMYLTDETNNYYYQHNLPHDVSKARKELMKMTQLFGPL